MKFEEALTICDSDGYVARDSVPARHIWKISGIHYRSVLDNDEDYYADDWKPYLYPDLSKLKVDTYYDKDGITHEVKP